MKKIFLTVAGLAALLQLYSQNKTDTGFLSRKLKIEEINLVSSYYSQDGDNAAVTGGIGSQKLTDIANVIDVRITKYDRKYRKHKVDAEIGIDHYTSASSDRIDLKANSSASHADTRIYPSLSWTIENEKKGHSAGFGFSSSSEYDYQSFGANFSVSKKTKDRSGEFTAKLQGYLDQVTLIQPIELRNGSNPDKEDAGTSSRKSFSVALSYSQVVNQRLQLSLLLDVVTQQGFLSLPFYRIYFNDGSVGMERLPDNRLKIPIAIRANYFLGDKIILRSYYRFYTDNWGLRSNTINIEIPIKLTPFLSISPFYRFYDQTGVEYFSGYRTHSAQESFYTSNYDLSKFNSNFFGTGLRLSPLNGVLGIKYFTMAEIRYGHYTKNIGMKSDILSLNFQFK